MSTTQSADLAVSRRAALRLLVSGAGLLILTACGTQQAPAAAPATAAATAVSMTCSTPQPRRGGTLRVGIPIDIAQLDGHFRTAPSYDSIWHVYEGLTSYDQTLKPQPRLA